MSRFSVIGRLYVYFFGRQTNAAAPNGISLQLHFSEMAFFRNFLP